jgi:hypothetical protein
MSEYEQPERTARQPSVEDVRQLMGASTPHFALHIRNRIRSLIHDLPDEHPARLEGEREIRRLDRIALGGERRGPDIEGLKDMPSRRGEDELPPESPAVAQPAESHRP